MLRRCPIAELSEAPEPPEPEIEQMDVDEAIHEAQAIEDNSRAWLKAVLPLMRLEMPEWGRSDRVTFAIDQVAIAACERARRILRSDLGPDQR